MATPIGSVRAELSAGWAGFRSDMGKAKKAVEENATGMQRAMDKVGRSFSGVAGQLKTLVSALAIGAAFRAVIIAASEAQQVVAQLEATLKSTGRYTPELAQNLTGYAAELQKITTYGDEAIISMQSLLLTFTRIGGDEFTRAQMAVLNVATALKTDLKTAALQVGKALNDPILGMTALSRTGIQFSEAQKATVKELMAVNDIAGAQKVILAELETQFGGSAEAARNTLGGALTALKNAFDDLLEGDSGGGGVKGTTQAIEELIQLLQNPETIKNAQTLANAMVTAFEKVLTAISKTVEFTKWLGEELASQVYGVAGDDIIRLKKNLDDAKAKLKELEDGYKAVAFADKLLGKVGISTDFLDKIRGIKSAREEVSRLQKQVDDYNESQAKGKPAAPKVPTAPNVPVMATNKTEGGGLGGGVSKRDATIERGQAAIKDLERELALLGDKSEVEKVLWELENGKYADLSKAHKERIAELVKEIEAGKAAIEAKKTEAEEEEEALKLQMKMHEEYEKEKEKKQAEFSEAHKRATLSTTEYELQQLQSSYDEYAAYIDDKAKLDEWYAAEKAKILDKSAEKENKNIKELKDAIEGWGRDSADAIVKFARTGEMSFSDMIDSMIDDLLRMMIYQNITSPLFGAISSGLGSLFGGAASIPATTGPAVWVAKGNVFQGGNVIPFARGGIVDRPTVFPMARGAGLMGEAGPEAVMPLTRINGDLGVRALAGGNTEVNIYNNVGADVSTKERTTADGSKAIDVYIDQAVAKKLGQFGPQSNRAMRQMGGRQPLTGR